MSTIIHKGVNVFMRPLVNQSSNLPPISGYHQRKLFGNRQLGPATNKVLKVLNFLIKHRRKKAMFYFCKNG